MTNTVLLRDRIAESGLKMEFICSKLGCTYATLRRKINNETEFTASEIAILSQLFHLTESERTEIFFVPEVS